MFTVSCISRSQCRRRFIRRTTALAGLAMLALPVAARAEVPYCDPTAVPLAPACLHANIGTGVSRPAGGNTERVAGAPGEGFAETGFSISRDNAPFAGAPPPFNPERSADIALARAEVDVRFDGLGGRRLLNVAAADLRA